MTATAKSPAAVYAIIADRFARRGDALYGEAVTEQEHALQCADCAMRADESTEMVVACLLHDFGHLVHDLGEDIAHQGIDAHHESVGAEVLAAYFPAEIVNPIRMHVAAKRYLAGHDATYLAHLSEASRRSLQLQGGPMNAAERAAFDAHPHAELAIQLRRYDDQAKIPGAQVPNLQHYRSMLMHCVRGAP